MTVQIATAAQHDFSKLVRFVGEMFSSLYNSIVFARLCEAEWAAEGRIDEATLKRICKLSNLDQSPSPLNRTA